MKFLIDALEICTKSALKHLIEKPNLLNFTNLSTIFCPGLQLFIYNFIHYPNYEIKICVGKVNRHQQETEKTPSMNCLHY